MPTPRADTYSIDSGADLLAGRGAAPLWFGARPFVLALASTSYWLCWPHAYEASGIEEYEYSINGGSWVSVGTANHAVITGRTHSTTDTCLVRATGNGGEVAVAAALSVTLLGSGAAEWDVSTIGTGGDYSTPAAWETATTLDLVSANRCKLGLCLNEEFSTSTISTPAMDMQGATVNSTHYRMLSAYPGASFVDHAGRRTNPLRYNASLGAAITNYAVVDDQDRMTIDLREGYARVTRLQIRSTGNDTTTFGGYVIHTSTSVPCWVDQCILETGSAKFTWSSLGPHIISNSMVICNRPASASQVLHVGEMGDNGGSGFAYNTQFVSLYQVATAATSITSTDGYQENCGYWNAAKLDDVISGQPTYVNCYSNAGTLRTGVTAMDYDATTGSGFENIGAGTEDFRLKSTSDLIGAGVVNATYSAIDITGKVRGATNDVGPWQY